MLAYASMRHQVTDIWVPIGDLQNDNSPYFLHFLSQPQWVQLQRVIGGNDADDGLSTGEFSPGEQPSHRLRDDPNVENGGNCRYVDGQLDVPPVLHIFGYQGQENNSDGPKGLYDAAGHGPIFARKELHDHGVSDALQSLNEYALDASEAHKDHEATDEMESNANDALRVKADEHDVLPAELVAKVAKDNATQHDTTKVGGGDERAHKLAVAYQAPLERKSVLFSST